VGPIDPVPTAARLVELIQRHCAEELQPT
jgi:hypothetical protein